MARIDPILGNLTPVYEYEPNTWGPAEANRLIGDDGGWHNPTAEEGGHMTTPIDVVFLFDVDNTLLDNDRVEKDLGHYLEQKFGEKDRDRYFAILEELRVELGYADYLGALQRYRLLDPCDLRLLGMSSYLVDYPFANRLYPGSLDALDHVRPYGLTVIVTDGDVVFQPRKVQRSGIWEVVEGRVLIYIHKEQMLDDVERNYPAEHYVMVDDKLRILTAMKKAWGDRLTTVWPRQGHYALDPGALAMYPRADITLERIGDLASHDLSELLGDAKSDQGYRQNPHEEAGKSA